MSKKPIAFGCLGAALVATVLCGGLLLLPIGRFMIASAKHMSVRERTTFSLNDGVHAIEHSRIGINPIVAEYSREVTYVTNGTRGQTSPLVIDTCGGYPINVYLIDTPKGPLLRLDDAVSEHLLDLSRETTYLVARVQGIAYIGVLTDERSSSGWSIMNDDPSTLSVTIGEAEAKPMVDLTLNAAEAYIGRIDGKLGRLRFIPAAESPEVQIDHLFDR